MDNPNSLNIEINFTSLQINYTGRHEQLRKQSTAYNGGIIAFEISISQIAVEEIKNNLTVAREVILGCMSDIKTHDECWFADNILHIYYVMNYIGQLCRRMNIQDHNSFNQEFFKVRSQVASIEKNNLKTNPDPITITREQLRKSDYLKYVISEGAEATYDNIMSTWNMVRHPWQTTKNIGYGMWCFAWKVGPIQSSKQIINQVWERPWYFSISFAETYAINYAINQVATKFINTTGIKEKIKSLTAKVQSETAQVKDINNTVAKTATDVEKIAKNVNDIQSKISTISDKLKRLSNLQPFVPVDEIEAFAAFCFFTDFDVLTSQLSGLESQAKLYTGWKEALLDKIKYASMAAESKGELSKVILDEVQRLQYNLKKAEQVTTGVNAAVGATSFSGRFFNYGGSFFSVMNNPNMRSTLFQFSKLMQAAKDIHDQLQRGSNTPSPQYSAV